MPVWLREEVQALLRLSDGERDLGPRQSAPRRLPMVSCQSRTPMTSALRPYTFMIMALVQEPMKILFAT